MCYYDLDEYDPFHSIYVYSDDGYWELDLDSDPMEDYNWEEWLEND
jgi:hypothetical protein